MLSSSLFPLINTGDDGASSQHARLSVSWVLRNRNQARSGCDDAVSREVDSYDGEVEDRSMALSCSRILHRRCCCRDEKVRSPFLNED